MLSRRTYHDIRVLDVRGAGADSAMMLRRLRRLLLLLALVFLGLACEWDFGDVYVLFLLRGGELLHVSNANSDRHVEIWACAGE